MERRKLGALEVSAIGLGCMSMTPIYGEPDPAEAIATLHHAAETCARTCRASAATTSRTISPSSPS
jgi:hypothetical protein